MPSRVTRNPRTREPSLDMLFCLAFAPAMSQALDLGRKITVPGSVSNMGPAFDVLSVAVGVYLTLEVLDIEDNRSGRVEFEFVGGPGPSGENRILSGFQRAQVRFGDKAPA